MDGLDAYSCEDYDHGRTAYNPARVGLGMKHAGATDAQSPDDPDGRRGQTEQADCGNARHAAINRGTLASTLRHQRPGRH